MAVSLLKTLFPTKTPLNKVKLPQVFFLFRSLYKLKRKNSAMPCLSIFRQFCSYCSLVLLLKMFLFYPSCCENVHINSLHLFSQQQRDGRTHTDLKCAREKNGSGKRIRHVKVCAWERDVFSPANHLKWNTHVCFQVIAFLVLSIISLVLSFGWIVSSVVGIAAMNNPESNNGGDDLYALGYFWDVDTGDNPT